MNIFVCKIFVCKSATRATKLRDQLGKWKAKDSILLSGTWLQHLQALNLELFIEKHRDA